MLCRMINKSHKHLIILIKLKREVLCMDHSSISGFPLLLLLVYTMTSRRRTSSVWGETYGHAKQLISYLKLAESIM